MKTLLVLLALAINLESPGMQNSTEKRSFSSHRLVAYVLADETQKAAIESAIQNYAWEITDRDILLVNLGEIEIETQHALELDESEKAAWRKLWQVGLDETRFVLVGKDGGAKAFQKDAITWQLFFDLIDTMPMRRAEMEATYRSALEARSGS